MRAPCVIAREQSRAEWVVQGTRARAIYNAGHGLGGAFLDQDFNAVEHVIDTNITEAARS